MKRYLKKIVVSNVSFWRLTLYKKRSISIGISLVVINSLAQLEYNPQVIKPNRNFKYCVMRHNTKKIFKLDI